MLRIDLFAINLCKHIKTLGDEIIQTTDEKTQSIYKV